MGTRARNKFTCIIDEPFISFVIFSISCFFGIRGLIFLCVIFFYTLFSYFIMSISSLQNFTEQVSMYSYISFFFAFHTIHNMNIK